MTNAHVVNGLDRVIVGLTNGKKLNASLIGRGFFTDIAILKIEGKGPWPKAKLAIQQKLKLVIGQLHWQSFGLENTLQQH